MPHLGTVPWINDADANNQAAMMLMRGLAEIQAGKERRAEEQYGKMLLQALVQGNTPEAQGQALRGLLTQHQAGQPTGFLGRLGAMLNPLGAAPTPSGAMTGRLAGLLDPDRGYGTAPWNVNPRLANLPAAEIAGGLREAEPQRLTREQRAQQAELERRHRGREGQLNRQQRGADRRARVQAAQGRRKAAAEAKAGENQLKALQSTIERLEGRYGKLKSLRDKLGEQRHPKTGKFEIDVEIDRRDEEGQPLRDEQGQVKKKTVRRGDWGAVKEWNKLTDQMGKLYGEIEKARQAEVDYLRELGNQQMPLRDIPPEEWRDLKPIMDNWDRWDKERGRNEAIRQSDAATWNRANQPEFDRIRKYIVELRKELAEATEQGDPKGIREVQGEIVGASEVLRKWQSTPGAIDLGPDPLWFGGAQNLEGLPEFPSAPPGMAVEGQWMPAGSKPQYQEGQTATNPTTGEKVIFQNGAWRPAK